nr:hypothetical protein [Lachnospiraceae bacterium]
GGSNWNSLAMKRNIGKEDCYLSKTMMQWVEQYRPLSEYSKKRCLGDFGLALKMYLKKPGRENLKFLQDMYEYGITHVVMKDKRTTLFGFAVRFLLSKAGLVRL